ncbi:MAG TPA: carboxyl transferase domain-containing protein, partial [Hymenobacter sp.]|uniref:carboxyl transferase domain-containing protein n=1 Tax=Hymenobacter sp. TaxID=1898978 RepID=UPI002ED9196F
EEQLSPYYAAARLWVDAVIDPLETRKVLSEGIAAANHAPIEKAYNVEVIQVLRVRRFDSNLNQLKEYAL